MNGAVVAGSAWTGAKAIFLPILCVIAVVIVLRGIAFIVKAKRGY